MLSQPTGPWDLTTSSFSGGFAVSTACLYLHYVSVYMFCNDILMCSVLLYPSLFAAQLVVIIFALFSILAFLNYGPDVAASQQVFLFGTGLFRICSQIRYTIGAISDRAAAAAAASLAAAAAVRSLGAVSSAAAAVVSAAAAVVVAPAAVAVALVPVLVTVADPRSAARPAFRARRRRTSMDAGPNSSDSSSSTHQTLSMSLIYPHIYIPNHEYLNISMLLRNALIWTKYKQQSILTVRHEIKVSVACMCNSRLTSTIKKKL